MSGDSENDDDWWAKRLRAFESLMCGVAQVLPGESGEEFTSGLVWVVAPAEDAADFEHLAGDAIAERRLALQRLERVQWLVDMDGHGPELLALAADAAEEDEAVVGGLIAVMEDAEVEAAAHEEETQWLAEARASARLVDIRHCFVNDEGFVVDYSDAFALHTVNRTTVGVDMHLAIRRDEMTELEYADDDFVAKALELKSERATDLGAPLESVEVLLRWAQEAELIVGLHEGRINPDTRAVGRVSSVGREFVILHGVRRDGSWTEHTRHALADITAVEIGGGYLSALALVADPPA
jgi:hypothetical protein